MANEHSQFLIDRFDHYYDSVNNKGNFLLAFNTFICGTVIVSYKGIIALVSSDSCSWYWLNILLICLLIFALISIAFILSAIYPYLKSGNKSPNSYHSLIFFGSISSLKEDEFINKFKSQTEDSIKEDLIRQIYQLANGLTEKYNKLKYAGYFIYFELGLLLPIFLILVHNKFNII